MDPTKRKAKITEKVILKPKNMIKLSLIKIF